MSSTLPPLSPEAQAHTDRCSTALQKLIQQRDGKISFAEWMEQALYAPGLGYYAAGNQRFGAKGDFITAPEISPLFAKALAEQCIEVLAKIGGDILEFGAGSGILALEILRHLAKKNSLPNHYYILEISSDLQKQQQVLLAEQAPELLSKVVWLKQLPENFIGIILANEVLDAMPVEQFVKTPDGFKQRFVTYHEDDFQYIESDIESAALITAINDLQASGIIFADGYISEINLWMKAWLASVEKILHQGVILLIDYGSSARDIYSSEKSKGTLRCFFQHQVHDNALALPGLQDITADVDFTAIATKAQQLHLSILGYTYQTYFLIDNHIMSFVEEDPKQKQAVKVLLLPQEMGARFKVIAFGKNIDFPLQGFTSFNLLHQL